MIWCLLAVMFADLKATTKERDYTACLAAVDRGETVYLVVGAGEPEKGDYTHPAGFDGLPNGRYRCWLEKGVRQMQLQPERAKFLPNFQPFGGAFRPGMFQPGCIGGT